MPDARFFSLNESIERREVFYSGRVQGVGFRYCARDVAEGFAVSGYVRNLPDGRVHLIVEGGVREVRSFLDELAARMERNIVSASEEQRAATGEFAGFVVRH